MRINLLRFLGFSLLSPCFLKPKADRANVICGSCEGVAKADWKVAASFGFAQEGGFCSADASIPVVVQGRGGLVLVFSCFFSLLLEPGVGNATTPGVPYHFLVPS